VYRNNDLCKWGNTSLFYEFCSHLFLIISDGIVKTVLYALRRHGSMTEHRDHAALITVFTSIHNYYFSYKETFVLTAGSALDIFYC
jgi:hypothetical protein